MSSFWWICRRPGHHTSHACAVDGRHSETDDSTLIKSWIVIFVVISSSASPTDYTNCNPIPHLHVEVLLVVVASCWIRIRTMCKHSSIIDMNSVSQASGLGMCVWGSGRRQRTRLLIPNQRGKRSKSEIRSTWREFRIGISPGVVCMCIRHPSSSSWLVVVVLIVGLPVGICLIHLHWLYFRNAWKTRSFDHNIWAGGVLPCCCCSWQLTSNQHPTEAASVVMQAVQ